MHPEPAPVRRAPPLPQPGRARTLPRAREWPFPAVQREGAPEMKYAALRILRTTARNWGLAGPQEPG